MLGDKIKELRIKKGLTQQQLADATNISRSAIGMVEKNKQGLGRENLITIANFFEVTVDYLLSNDIKVDIDSTSNKLGDKIKDLRKDRNLTQVQLAKEIGIAQSTLGMIEKNRTPAGRKTLIKLADFFGVTVDYLLSDDIDNKEINIDDVKNVKLSKRAEKDIEKALQQTLEDLSNTQDGLMFSGEPIDDETRELLKISLENSMRLAKQIAKQKYTPKKYK
ncbi:helix-turn-helix domain-containing protein [Clostridium cuniculi]|uniref:helix-turn-helix domain-containing protein n=1 Tax=Clostridium cuniculi TaxID=2548455 RepID=UPI001FAADF77|nr:helix-turn-helix transcriptional regulator [Clostridium cuniculi]